VKCACFICFLLQLYHSTDMMIIMCAVSLNIFAQSKCSALANCLQFHFAMSPRFGMLRVADVRCFLNVNFLIKHGKSFNFHEFGPGGPS